MAYSINAYMDDRSVIIEPLSTKRDFFDKSSHKSAYKCLPISSANLVGWGISFSEDISFIWDGEDKNFQEHVKIIFGSQYIDVADNGTISFNTKFSLKTEDQVSIFITPVPNQFSDSWSVISATLSTSFYHDAIRFGVKILKPNELITIPANTPVASILPISFTELNDSVINIFDWSERDFSVYNENYAKAMEDSRYAPELAGFYRNAWNHKKEKIGEHEVKYLNLKTIEGKK